MGNGLGVIHQNGTAVLTLRNGLGNAKTMINGNHKEFKFRKYSLRYFGAYLSRFK